MKNLILKLLAALVCATALLYVADWSVFRVRMARGSAFDTVNVNAYYAVPQKNGKTEYDVESSGPQSCAKAIFPRMGCLPCWYLRRHADQEIKL